MTYHYFKPRSGGVEEVVYEISRNLVKKNVDVTVLTSNIGGHKELLPEREVIGGINVIRCEASPWIFRTLKLKGFKDKLREINPDIFHTHHPIPGVSDETIFFAKKNNIPSTLTYHADSQEDTIMSKIAAKIYYQLIAKKMVKSSDAVVAHTRSYAETSPVLKHFLDRVIINPIGVDTKRFNPKTTDGGVREKYNIEDKFVIFTLGRLVPYKGYQYLVKAMKYLDDNFVLVLAGDGMLKNSLMSLTKKLNIEDKIIFTGHLPESKKTNYYASCDVFCLPSISRGEAFGVVLLEAMACGKHVITTSIPGVSEVASIGGGHIVEPKNPVALADAIKESKKIDVDKYKLHQKIESRFSWDKIVGKYLSIYKELG